MEFDWFNCNHNLDGSDYWSDILCSFKVKLFEVISLTTLGIFSPTLFRVDEKIELRGLDIFKHGEPAYPKAAQGHGWANERHTVRYGELNTVNLVRFFSVSNSGETNDAFALENSN